MSGRRRTALERATLRAWRELGVPLKLSLGTLGQDWSLEVLRDIAFKPTPSFGDLLEQNPGLTSRVLVLRLGALVHEGLVEGVPDGNDRRKIRYRLAEPAVEVIPLMIALIQFAARRRARLPPSEVLHESVGLLGVPPAGGARLRDGRLEAPGRSQ
jgi:DNA-binding HxlR family transcriptional regulator